MQLWIVRLYISAHCGSIAQQMRINSGPDTGDSWPRASQAMRSLDMCYTDNILVGSPHHDPLGIFAGLAYRCGSAGAS